MLAEPGFGEDFHSLPPTPAEPTNLLTPTPIIKLSPTKTPATATLHVNANTATGLHPTVAQSQLANLISPRVDVSDAFTPPPRVARTSISASGDGYPHEMEQFERTPAQAQAPVSLERLPTHFQGTPIQVSSTLQGKHILAVDDFTRDQV